MGKKKGEGGRLEDGKIAWIPQTKRKKEEKVKGIKEGGLNI